MRRRSSAPTPAAPTVSGTSDTRARSQVAAPTVSGTSDTRARSQVAAPMSTTSDTRARSQVAAPAALAKVAKQLAAHPVDRTARGTRPPPALALGADVPAGTRTPSPLRSDVPAGTRTPSPLRSDVPAGTPAHAPRPPSGASDTEPRSARRANSDHDDRAPLDIATATRPVSLELIGGRSHYERVIAAVLGAHTSVWIATANVKSLMVEDGRAAPGRRRTIKRSNYVSIVALLDVLAQRGVELRLLHAELPSSPFREEIAKHPRLAAGGLELARCPRVHMKAVIVDGALLYLGSANWTGAGLGAKGAGRRNFELGIVTDDGQLLDEVQSLYDRVWSGAECAGCKLTDVCPGPLAELRALRKSGSDPITARSKKRRSGKLGSAPITARSRKRRSGKWESDPIFLAELRGVGTRLPRVLRRRPRTRPSK